MALRALDDEDDEDTGASTEAAGARGTADRCAEGTVLIDKSD